MTTKIFNFRPILYVALSILLGLLLSYFVLLKNYVGILTVSLLAFIAIILVIFKIKILKKKHFLCLFICIVCFIISFFGLNIKFSTYNATDIEKTEITDIIALDPCRHAENHFVGI